MTDKRKPDAEKIGQMCFWAGLLLEILIVIIDKSSYINPIEGQMFRLTFLLFAVKLCLTEYTAKEWGAVLLAGIIAGICYLSSTRDEAVRVVVFVAAMKGIDYKKALKTVFWCTLAGLAVLAALALAGVLGEVYDAGAGYGFKEGVPRLCLGVGNSNALACMIWALMTLGIYLYHEKMKLWHYGLLAVLTYLTYRATVTRTTFLVMALTLVGAVVFQYGGKLRKAKWIYISGYLTVLFCIGFSVLAAAVSNREIDNPLMARIDEALTNRIMSICVFTNGGGILENWRLFGHESYVHYFDMGYVRLFYWYGIIPGLCCVAMLLLLIRQCGKSGDALGLLLIVSFAVYTLIEAHIVSVYIARNYLLLLAGGLWTAILQPKGAGKAVFWWRPKELFRAGKSTP